MRTAIVLLGLGIGAARLPAQLATVDTNARRLTPRSLNDPAAVYSRYAVTPKGEFETSAHYIDRVSRRAAPGGFLAFGSAAACLGATPFEYDADRAAFSVQLANIDRAVILRCTSALLRTYEASNAFGAKRLVRVYSRRFYAVMLPDVDALPPILQFSMQPRLAQRAKPALRAALVVKLQDGLTASWLESREEATFDSPVESSDTVYVLMASRAFLWVYDAKTMEVHAKFDLADPLTFKGGIARADSIRQGALKVNEVVSEDAARERMLVHARERVEIVNPRNRSEASAEGAVLQDVGSATFSLLFRDGRTEWYPYSDLVAVSAPVGRELLRLVFRK